MSEIMKLIFVISFLAIFLAYAKAWMIPYCSICDVGNSNISFPTCCELGASFRNDCKPCKCILHTLPDDEKKPLGSCTYMDCPRKPYCDPKFEGDQTSPCCRPGGKYTFDGKEYQCNLCGFDAVKLS